MSVTSRRLRSTAAVALSVGLALGMAACSKKKDDSGSADTGPVTITLQYFGTPGFDQAVKDFEAANTNIKVDVQLVSMIACEEGLRFAIREGGKTVGAGVVTKILAEDPPVKAAAAAKAAPAKK